MKRLTLGLLGMAAFLAISATAAKADTTITFDDISDNGNGTLITNGYNGLDWNNFYVLNAVDFASNVGANGYTNGIVSSPNVAYNGYGNEASITSGSAFTFDSAYFNAAWSNGLSITVNGLLNGNLAETSTFVVNTAGPATLETFNWSGINELDFTSSGGNGTQFAMDNLTVTTTPEPPSLIFLGSGLLAMMGFLKFGRRMARPAAPPSL
jgi:hypothetical protein